MRLTNLLGSCLCRLHVSPPFARLSNILIQVRPRSSLLKAYHIHISQKSLNLSLHIKFRYFTMLNNGDGTDIYPCMWTVDEHKESWDGRHNSGTYWFLNVGMAFFPR